MQINYEMAFQKWRSYISACGSDCIEVAPSILGELQLLFAKVALSDDFKAIFEAGRKYGFAPVSVLNILILHGAYPRLVKSGILLKASSRHIDSCYQPTFPLLNYNLAEQSVLAPWITCPAQEALLDMDLTQSTVVEYGSGISTFFFTNYAARVVSFEDDVDPAGGISWTKSMQEFAIRYNYKLELVAPTMENTRPKDVHYKYWNEHGKLIVLIDGIDRERHFREWASYITENTHMGIVLLIDNSEIADFEPIFQMLYESNASLVHYYGEVYGQIARKQCTSFVTMNNKHLHTMTISPNKHDTRWGKMNFQL